MHQASLNKMCPLKAFQLPYCPDNDAKSMVKHLIFLQKFAVLHCFGRRHFLHYCSCPIAWVSLFITAPAHLHATLVAMYPALFQC